MGTITDTRSADALFPRTRQAILAALFGHPDRAFYLRELANYAGLSLSQLQRELSRLVAGGLVRRFEQGRHVYFQADRTSPIFAELRELIKKTFGLVDPLKEALAPYTDEICVAFVYGSMAGGEESQSSDLDLMIIGGVSLRTLSDVLRPVEDNLNREINVTSYGTEDFREKVLGGHHFLTSVMRTKKIFVIGDDRELGALLDEQVDQEASNVQT